MATMAPVSDGPASSSTSNVPNAPPGPIATPAATTQSPTATLGGPTLQTRLPTMGGSGESIALPMTGPSRRTMMVAASGIAVAGIAIGALVAMRALRPGAPPPPPPESDTNVALVETPHVIGQGDADVNGDASVANGNSGSDQRGARTRVRTANGNGAGTTAVAPNAATTTGAGIVPSAGVTGRNTGAANSSGNGTHVAAGGATTGSGASANAGGGTDNTAGNTGGSGAAPAPGDLAQLAAAGNTTGGGISPRGPTVGGYVQGEETDATGTMDPTVFSYVYRHYRPQVAACQSMVTRNVAIAGTMRVRVRLGVDGHVARTRVLSNSTNNDELATCVQNSIHSWAYPRPEGGEVEFDYNFGFGS